MDSKLKTITTTLVLATFAFLGYYLYSQQGTALVGGLEGVNTQALAEARKFIEYRQQLDQVKFDTTLFRQESFRSLKPYTTEVPSQPVARPNPFDRINFGPETNPGQ